MVDESYDPRLYFVCLFGQILTLLTFFHNRLHPKYKMISQKFSNVQYEQRTFIGIPALKNEAEGVEFILIIYQIRNSVKA